LVGPIKSIVIIVINYEFLILFSISLNEFSAALRMIDSRKFNYLQRLIKATKLFVRAKKKVIIDRQKKLKQKKEIENAKLSDE